MLKMWNYVAPIFYHIMRKISTVYFDQFHIKYLCKINNKRLRCEIRSVILCPHLTVVCSFSVAPVLYILNLHWGFSFTFYSDARNIKNCPTAYRFACFLTFPSLSSFFVSVKPVQWRFIRINRIRKELRTAHNLISDS